MAIEIRTTTDGIPYIKRVVELPPGIKNPEIIQNYGMCDWGKVREKIGESPLTLGAKNLLYGIWQFGGVALFKGNGEVPFDLGINYDRVFKHTFHTELARYAADEINARIRNTFGVEEIQGILSPEYSSLKFATLVSERNGGIPIVSVRKNGNGTKDFQIKLDAYTAGCVDTMSIDDLAVRELIEQRIFNFYSLDDIIDSGAATVGTHNIVKQAQKKYPIRLLAVATPVEKMYTNGRANISREIGGDVPIISVLQIEDIGVLDENRNQGWIKAKDMPTAIPCRLADLR